MTAPSQPPPTAKTLFAELGTALVGKAWYADATTTWPAPIAHELDQLARMLNAGTDAGGILMQVRDTAEALLKTIVLVAAQDLIHHGDSDASTAARRALFSRQMSLGAWNAALEGFRALPTEPLMASELITLANPKQPFLKAMKAYAHHRNRDTAHGAYRPDSIELAHQVELQLLGPFDRHTGHAGGLDQAFSAVAATAVWRHCTLRADDQHGPALAGAGAHGPRPHAHPDHSMRERRVLLVRGERALDLFPFIVGRICGECPHRDAFLYDSPRAWKRPKDDPRFDFLDYANGHHLTIDARQTDHVLADLADFPMSDLELAAALARPRAAGEFSSADVIRLLDSITFDNRFMSPEWLRTPLRDHMGAHPSGIVWLQAPAHVGKTMFVRGLSGEWLTETEKDRERNLLPGKRLDVAPIFLKREYRYERRGFATNAENAVRAALRADSRFRLVIPEPNPIDPADPHPHDAIHRRRARMQAGFAAFLAEAARASYATGDDRLIVAIDGLDELADPTAAGPDEPTVLDYIPDARDIPDGVTLLLTSRPPSGCAPWIQSRLTEGFAAGCHVHAVGIDDPGYRALLYDYVSRHAGVPADHPDFEELFETVLARSGSLFLVVSFLCDLISDGVAPA